jgi:hypothetical protein
MRFVVIWMATLIAVLSILAATLPGSGDTQALHTYGSQGGRGVQPMSMSCNVSARPEQTQADFTASDKESPGALGPRLALTERSSQEDINAAVRAVICGVGSVGGNRLVLEGILTALRDGHPLNLTRDEWVNATSMVMEGVWIPERTTPVACRVEKPDAKTVYGQRVGGKLKLAITTIHTQRRSCYVGLVFNSLDVAQPLPQMIRLRLECFLQATTFRGSRGQPWHVTEPQG